MRRIVLGLAFSAFAAAAVAQDRPPPGCRWQDFQGEETLACKDGKGYWRRSGDDEIVGTYPLPKPKPKPAPTPVPRTAANTHLSGPFGAELAPRVLPPPSPPPAEETPQTPEAVAEATARAEAKGERAAPPPAEAAPAAAKPEPWWKRFFGGIWKAILGFLKAVGLVR
jgi:hypothetical protein